MQVIPKKTIKEIVDSGNHYVAQVKRNQPRLFQGIEQIIMNQCPLDFYEYQQRIKGADVTWSVLVYEAHVGAVHKDWSNLKRIVQVHKRVEKQKSITTNQRFYISDLTNDNARYYYKGIRQHWGIENRLHWVKDVVHKEDKNRIRIKNGPINMSIFSAIAINIHRKNGNDSITEGQIKFCCNLRRTLKIIDNC